ncbi:HAD family phosphatase [Alcanivorax sp. DP30]|uniref:HAD family hydrolase n=1 Tax=Alcanivorax sp. DP30 TaxID=2606217 RepID=UPI00136B0FEF|nr:HAD-IB family phosphatase [Alcanivorax sp. DP30]MZR64303.1 HAD-IB family phosphatase [Alcanivorax sp. DP30]
MKSKFPKIFFFDLEGTLLKKDFSLDNGKVAPSAWTVLAKALGEQCYREEEETKDKWLSGEYKGYLDWMAETVRIHQRHGLTKEIFDAVIASSELQNGVEETIIKIKEKGAIVCIISGGFKALCDKIQPKIKPDHFFCACEYFFDENGRLDSCNLLPTDEKGKVTFMKLIAEEHCISINDCAFVGDGKNDIHLAKEVGFSIAFNAQEELVKASTVSITQDSNSIDFQKILSFFEI